MPRFSVETTKSVLASLLEEQARDRDHLLRMLAQSDKMIAHLQRMRNEEETRIESEANDRRDSVRKIFDQLIAVEEERKMYIALQVTDIDGPKTIAEATAASRQQKTAAKTAKKLIETPEQRKLPAKAPAAGVDDNAMLSDMSAAVATLADADPEAPLKRPKKLVVVRKEKKDEAKPDTAHVNGKIVVPEAIAAAAAAVAHGSGEEAKRVKKLPSLRQAAISFWDAA